MELKEIEKNIEHIESRNYQKLALKKKQILRELDYLLEREQDLLDLKPRYERLKKIIDSDESMFRLAMDEYHGFRLGREFEPLLNKMDSYNDAYYKFMFRFHEMVCSPNLYSKHMSYFNYQIPLGYDPTGSKPHDAYVNDGNVEISRSIDAEFYQIELLRLWGDFINHKNYEMSYYDLRQYFLNNFNGFRYSDVAVTHSSKGASRVENSLVEVRKVFRKIGLINKKNDRITIFGIFVVKIMTQTSESRIGGIEEYRGIKSCNKHLAKPINDLLFDFDMNDYDKLKISRSSYEELNDFLNDYKSNPDNIAIYNMPNYL